MNELITKESLFIKDQDGQVVVAPDALEAIRAIEVEMKQLNKKYKKYKEVLLNGMEDYGLKKVDTDDLLISYVEPTERISLDQDKLWKEHKDVAWQCQKVSPVKASIRITVR